MKAHALGPATSAAALAALLDELLARSGDGWRLHALSTHATMLGVLEQHHGVAVLWRAPRGGR